MSVSHEDLVGMSLLKPLPHQEREVLRNILITYNTDDSGTQLMKAMRCIDSLGTHIQDGYVPLSGKSVPEYNRRKKITKWRKDLQKHINYLASYRVGRDRQAIALAYFRDFVMLDDLEDKVNNLCECRQQLLDLYNTIAPNPFEW